MEKEILALKNELIRRVHHFYPIGVNGFSNFYAGHKELLKIIEKKIDSEANNENAGFNIFCKELQNRFPNLKVENRIYYQFPNYVTYINLPHSEYSDINHRAYFVICISLLTDYYTLYFEESYYFTSYTNVVLPSKNGLLPSFNIHSFELNSGLTKKVDISFIKQHIETSFPGKKFVPHHLIKKWTITGNAPYGELEDPQNSIPYSMFEFLFAGSSGMRYPSVEVIE